MAQSRPDPDANAAPNRRYTSEAANVATGADVTSAGFDPKLLAFEETGGFFDLLAAADHSLFVTREYEHFLLALDGGTGRAHPVALSPAASLGLLVRPRNARTRRVLDPDARTS